MKKLVSSVFVLASVGSGLGAFAPSAGAASVSSSSLPTYEHGLYAQEHSASWSACQSMARDAAIALKKSSTVKNVQVGSCVAVNAQDGNVAKKGFVYNLVYQSASGPFWGSDTSLGTSPGATAGMHSFKTSGTYVTKDGATNTYNALKTALGGSVTWFSGVQYSTTTQQYTFEIDYNAYGAHNASSDVEISENPNVTSLSIGKSPLPTTQPSTVSGLDVSGYTTVANTAASAAKDANQFIIAKVNEGQYYLNAKFAGQQSATQTNGKVFGAYDFANPSSDTGAQEADYFVAHGGFWKANTNTLPGALDIEWNPYGSSCYNLNKSQMNTWIRSYVTEYHRLTGVNPLIYTANAWWTQCVGTPDYSDTYLWLANYNTTYGPVPASWNKVTFWQYGTNGSLGADLDVFEGTPSQLKSLANTGSF